MGNRENRERLVGIEHFVEATPRGLADEWEMRGDGTRSVVENTGSFVLSLE